MKKSNTKRSLVASVTSLVLCCALLIGTTFAWFTDSVSTGKNTIASGNLDVELYQVKDSTETKVDENTKLFNENALWEPGYTEVVYLKVANEGSLALKYQFAIDVVDTNLGKTADGQDIDLSQYLRFAVVENASAYATREEARAAADAAGTQLISNGFASTEGHLSADAKSDLIAIVVYMPEEVGNEANHNGTNIPTIDLGLQLVATQDTVESDSFDNQYDADALYPIVVSSQEGLNDTITSAEDNSEFPTSVILPAGEFKLENSIAKNKNITIKGTEDTIITVVGDTGNQLNYQNGATLAFEGVTIQGQTAGNYGGIAHVAETTFVNCTFNGKLTLYGDATFINCTFSNDNDYAIWTWGAKNAEFIGCTFNSGGKALLLYGGAGSTETPTTNLTVTNCTSNDNNSLDTAKAAIETGNDYNAVYNLTVNNISVNGFAKNPEGISTDSIIWANKNSMDQDHLNVVIDGVDVY